MVEDEFDLKRSFSRVEKMEVDVAPVIDASHKKSAVVCDPDGLEVEFYHPREADSLRYLPEPGGDLFWIFDY